MAHTTTAVDYFEDTLSSASTSPSKSENGELCSEVDILKELVDLV